MLVLNIQIVKLHLLLQLLMLLLQLLQLLVLDDITDITLYLYSCIRYLTNLHQRLLMKGILLLLLAMKDRLNICLLLDLNVWVQLLLLVLLLLPQVGPEEWWIQIWIVIEM